MKTRTIQLKVIVILIALLAILALCVTACAPRSDQKVKSATVDLTESTALASNENIVTYSTPSEVPTERHGNYYLVRTIRHMRYVLTTEDANAYLLMDDFVVADSGWASHNTATAKTMTISGKGYDSDWNETGENHTLTFRPNVGGDVVKSTTTNGGLFGVFDGVLRDLNYRFEGRLEVDLKASNLNVVYYGGLAGQLSGTIDHCTISYSGTIMAYGNADGKSIFSGGLAGVMKGATITDSDITIAGAIYARNKSSDDDDVTAKQCIMYAGGLAGSMENSGTGASRATTITNCIINNIGAVYANDLGPQSNTFWSSGLNDDDYFFAAGGLAGQASSLYFQYNEAKVQGKVYSTGGAHSSKNGAASGGLIGISTSGASLTIKNNVLTVTAIIRSESTRVSGNTLTGYKFEGDTCEGGIIGRMRGNATASGFASNAIYFEDKIARVETDNKDGTDYYGYVVGFNSGFASFNGGGNWFVYRGGLPAAQQVGFLNDIPVQSTNGSNVGNMGRLMVYGGGNISTSINRTTGRLIFEAKQQYSPFYKWLSNLSDNVALTNASEVAGNTFSPLSSTGVIYAVFLTRQIDDSGKYVQWTEEMGSGLNFAWNRVELTDDVTVSVGVNLLYTYAGSFEGNGHTVTFANGVTMYANRTGEAGDEIGGLFGTLASGANVQNVKIVFAGILYGGNQTIKDKDNDYDTTVTMGLIAGVNEGTISNVDVTISQAGKLIALGREVVLGGLVGINRGVMEYVNLVIDGTLQSNAETSVIGGMIGRQAEQSGGVQYNHINIDLRGQLIGRQRDDTYQAVNCKMGGLVGVSQASMSLKDVAVNVRDTSNSGGDVLTMGCTHNTNAYSGTDGLLSLVNQWTPSNSASLIPDIVDALDDVNVALASKVTQHEVQIILFDVQARGIATVAAEKGLSPQVYFVRYIENPIRTMDSSAPCSSCQGNCKKAVFVADYEGYSYGLNNTWVLGSFKQYNDRGEDYATELGTRALPYFGNDLQDTNEVTNLNYIFVRDGSAVANLGSDGAMMFSVPLDDDSHVFTGWYTNFDQSVMVGSSYVVSQIIDDKEVSCFVPGKEQAGKVFFSSVIANLITTGDELDFLATTTAAGQRYEGVTFSLGADINFSGAFVPIGNKAHPFGGTLDGKLHVITFAGGFDLDRAVDGVGLFGVLDSSACVKQLTIVVTSSAVSCPKQFVFGAIAGFNYGTIGDSRQQDVSVLIETDVSGAKYIGGAVGVNYGLIQNIFVQVENDKSLSASGLGEGDTLDEAGVAGGVVAINDGLGTVRNMQFAAPVHAEVLYGGTVIADARNATSYAGGLVGLNLGNAYSGVVDISFEEEGKRLVLARGIGSAHYAGLLLGSNGLNADIDSLWAVYLLPTDGFLLPTTNAAGEYNAVLINGTDADKANRLIRYGYGSINTEIYANMEGRQLKGGSIVFGAASDATNTPFYAFIMSLDAGEVVQNASGEIYSPVVSSISTQAVEGQTCYAVFVDYQINNKEELYALAALINSGFQAYANYILKLTGTTLQLLPTDPGYATIGTAEYPFVGTFDSNGYTIEIRSEGASCLPFFGVIAEASSVRNMELRFNASMTATAAINFDGLDALGLLACVNLGTVNSVHLVTLSSLEGTGAVGAMVGYNKGKINGTSSVELRTDNTAGLDIASGVSGEFAGGLVGINAQSGVIGSDMLAGVSVTIANGTVQAYVHGTQAAGGIVGINYGSVNGVVVEQAGNVYGSTHAGSVAGANQGSIGASTVLVGATSTFVVGTDIPAYVGGVVGANQEGGIVGVESSTIRVTWASPASLAIFGGAAGRNEGLIQNISVTLNDSVSGDKLGGLVGEHRSSLTTSEVILNQDVTLAGSLVGGLVGDFGKGNIQQCSGSIYGTLSASLAGGGFIGRITASSVESALVDTCFMVLSNDIAGAGIKGLAMGAYRADVATNTWVVASNRIRTLAVPDGQEGSGFNVLKIVGNATVIPSFVTRSGGAIGIRLTAGVISGMSMKWYQDISKLESDGYTSQAYDCQPDWKDKLYHVCYYDLEIDTASEFYNLYLSINAADLFNGVMFRLNSDITIEGQMLQPIGTAVNPFRGIFEGGYHTITLGEGSGIAGTDYSGLFGYVAKEAVIRHFILDVKEDVLLGSTCMYVGGLAGRIDGSVVDVAIHLGSDPASKLDGAKMGGLAGIIGTDSHFENTWVVLYNGGAPKVGQGPSGDANCLNVLGSGKVAVSMDSAALQEGKVQFVFDVTEALDYFDQWYTDISSAITFAVAGGAGALGTYSPTGTATNLSFAWYKPLPTLTGSDFTVSFIGLVIRNAQDFANFAHNINTYGDQGAKFTMDLGYQASGAPQTELVIDLTEFAPIGNRKHPFTGTFDGTVPYALASSRAYTIIVKGNITKEDNQYARDGLADYCGLFGNVGEGALIQNLVIRADSSAISEDYQGQTIGFNGSMYTGFVASYLAGTLRNVVAILDAGTKIVNIHDDALGGMVGVMAETAVCNNAWLILPENSTYHTVGGLVKDKIIPYGQIDPNEVSLPSLMYLCGDGILGVTYVYNHSTANPSLNVDELQFSLTPVSGGAPAYGFVDGTLLEPVPTSRFVSKADEGVAGKDYLAIFVNPDIASYEDLQALSVMLNEQNRSYLGVTFRLTQDIRISGVEWTPIGGNVLTGSGEYKRVPFIGVFDGQGHTITFAGDVTCNAPYAGMFGLLASTARVRNLYIDTQASFGGDDTEYAGVLAGLDYGAALTNVIVRFGKSASLNAEIDTGRVAVNDALLYDMDGRVTNYDSVNKGVNVWVLNYNSRYNVTQNSKEKAFFDTIGSTWQGTFNGGANVVTVVAAGEMEISFITEQNRIVGVRLTNPEGDGNPIKEWYSVEDGGNISYDYGNTYTPDYDSFGKVLYASYLQDEIGDLQALLDLARDNNDGYDLYGLTFRLTRDVVIDSAYEAIGNESTPFSAVFDGDFHTITLAQGVVVDGLYAGIFGSLGETGIIQNLKMEIKGALGVTTYVESEIAAGKVNTQYAGAVAYNRGKLSSVIVDVTSATIRALTLKGAAFGYDAMNYADNTWVIFNAANGYELVGRVESGVASTVNSMEIVGVGGLNVDFYYDDVLGHKTQYVLMRNDTGMVGGNTYAVKGWYSDFSRDYQLSKSLKVTALETEVTAGSNGSYLASADLINRRFQVVIMTTLIRTQEELLAIADDVNKGGYTFRDTVFTLGSDIEINSTAFTSIGTEATPFEGSFIGSFNGSYYQIILNRYSVNDDLSQNDEGIALFGVVTGKVSDLTVQVNRNFHQGQSTIGCVANINRGTIENCLVVVKSGVIIDGAYVGGVAGLNAGTISNCIVRVSQGSRLSGLFAAGGLVGQNEGVILGTTGGSIGQTEVWSGTRYAAFGWTGSERLADVIASVLLDGTIEVTGVVGGNMGAGGAVGTSQNRGNIQRITVRISTGGRITSGNGQAALGGLVGRSTGIIANCIVTVDGDLDGNVALQEGAGQGHDYVGYFGGNIQGTVANSWLVVPVPSTFKTVGNGSAVNVLQVSGGGRIDSYLDSDNNIIFTNIDAQGAELDGWYVGSGTAIPANVGNVDGDTFRPATIITGWTVNVIFINTNITSVDDLNRMAQTVNAGLFAPNLVFYLQNDLAIDADHPLIAAIGNEDNGFKHNFYGQGHSITFVGDGIMPEGNLMGLFGYVTASASIYDLHVIIKGANGSSATSAIGGIAGINNGRIENCSVQLGDSATTSILRGVQVGGMVGNNGSTARLVGGQVYNYGMLQGLGVESRNVFVGGVVGLNAGRIDGIEVYHSITHTQYNVQATFESNSWSGTAYAGGVSGNNTGEINRINVTFEGAVFYANSNIIAYAGGVVGSNTGIVESFFVSVGLDLAGNRTSIGVNRGSAGGIAGINNQGLRNGMIEIFANSSSVGDSAVGGWGNNAFADNVWVFNDNHNLNSTQAQINNMTYQLIGGVESVTHNAKEEIYSSGLIVFDAIIDPSLGLSVYADAHQGVDYPAFRKVLLDDVIIYEDGFMRLLPVTGTSDREGTRGIWARAEIRRSFADETELKALAKAMDLGGQVIRDADNGEVYSLAADIVITGDFAAIGTQLNPFTATLEGNLYEVVFTEGVNFDGISALFGEVGNGAILRNLVVRHYVSLTGASSAGVVLNNRGSLSNIVVYAEEGVSLSNAVYRSNDRDGDNLWLISRLEVNIGNTDVKTIVVHGEGDVVIANVQATVSGAEPLMLAPQVWDEVAEYTAFAGWTADNRMLEREFYNNNNFNTANKTGEYNYTAEFLSTRLGTQAQFAVLLTLLGMEYTASNVQFDMVADIDFDLSAYPQDMQAMSAFRGMLDGHFYTLRLLNANTRAVFGDMQTGNFRDLVLDVRDFGDETYLWYSYSTVALQDVYVKTVRTDARLADDFDTTLRLNRVYVLTDNADTLDNLDQYVTDKVGVIYTTQIDLIGFGGTVTTANAIAGEDETHFFVGWLIGSTFHHESSVTLTGEMGANRIYQARFISSVITSEEEFEVMRQAIEGGFTFQGKTLTLGADLVLDSATVASTGVFKATLDGNGHRIDWLSSNAVFGNFQGKLVNLLLVSESGIIVQHASGAEIRDTVIVASGFRADDVTCVNAWVLTDEEVTAKDLNHILLDLDQIEVAGLTYDDGLVLTLRAVDTLYYLLWKDADGKVWVNERYDSIVLSGQGKRLGVVVSDEVSDTVEMECYGIATAHGYLGNIYLTADIELSSGYNPLTRAVFLNGQGHTITILEDNMVLLQNITGTTSVRDLRIDVKPGLTSFTLNNSMRGKLINVVVSYKDDTAISLGGNGNDDNYENVWLLHDALTSDDSIMSTSYSYPATVSVLRYWGGRIEVTFAQEDIAKCTFTAIANEGYTFFSFYGDRMTTDNTLDCEADDIGYRIQAKFIRQYIGTADDWNNLVGAMRDAGGNGEGRIFYLAQDLVFDSTMEPLIDFGGTLDGNGNSLIVDHALDIEPWSLSAQGKVRNLALEIKANPSVPLTWFAELNTSTHTYYERVWVVSYVGAVSQGEGGQVIIINQGIGQGAFEVNYDQDGFVFDPVDDLEYKLHEYEMDGTVYLATDVDPHLVDGKTYYAYFDNCYSITIIYQGVEETAIKPTVLISNPNLWSTDTVSTVEAVLSAGYLFLGFDYPATPAISDGGNCMTLTVDASLLTSSVAITARYVSLTSEWTGMTYGDMTPAELSDYLTLSEEVWAAMGMSGLDDAGGAYQVTRSILRNGDTLEVDPDTKMPVHAGNYNVVFEIVNKADYKQVGLSVNLVFTISKRVLYFDSITLAERNYDGTADAKVTSLIMGGMIEQDAANRSYLNTDNVHLQYYDAANGRVTATAGTWNLIVREDSFLDCNSDLYYFQYDYELPFGDVLYQYVKRAGVIVKTTPYERTINKQVLNLTVNTVTVSFLDQFGKVENGVLTPFDISKVLQSACIYDQTGLSEEDKAVIAEAHLLLVSGDSIVWQGNQYVYNYNLRHVGNYDILPNREALQNYEPRISERTALFCVVTGRVEVELAHTEIEYGNKMSSLNYRYYRLLDEGREEIMWSEDNFDLYRGVFANVNTYADFAEYAALDVRPVCAVIEGEDVDESGLTLGTYQVKYAVGTKTDSVLASTAGYVPDYQQGVYVAVSEAVLEVVPRIVTYRFTTGDSKEFGGNDNAFGGRAVAGGLVGQDKLVFYRDQGELVGDYAIHAKVVSGDEDVSANYELIPEREYLYHIVGRVVYVKRVGNNVFHYGSSEISNMSYGLSISDEVISNIVKALGVSNLSAVFNLRIGYFGAIHPVGEYRDITINDNIRASKVSDEVYERATAGLTFVLDQTSNRYSIVPQTLTIQAVDVKRQYDSTANLTGVDDNSIKVSGWIDAGDRNRLEVHVGSWQSDIRADAGIYQYRPVNCTLTVKAGVADQSILRNYTIGRIVAGRYTIERLDVTVNVAVGTFDQQGTFVPTDSGEVLFGDPGSAWFFEVDDLPGYLGELYEQFLEYGDATDQGISRYLQELLSLKVYAVSSLAAGHIISSDNNDKMEDCYSQNSNLTVSFVMNDEVEIMATKIVLTDVSLVSTSEYALPTVSFKVKAYRESYAGGSLTWVEMNDYLASSSYEGIKVGEIVPLNNAIAVQFASRDTLGNGNFAYSLVPFVKDGDTLYEYKQDEDNAVMYVAETRADGSTKEVMSNEMLQAPVDMQPGFWQDLADRLLNNAAVLGAVLGGILVLGIGLAVTGVLLNKRRRLKNAVKATRKQEAVAKKIKNK